LTETLRGALEELAIACEPYLSAGVSYAGMVSGTTERLRVAYAQARLLLDADDPISRLDPEQRYQYRGEG
jgi:hypothetical protein